MSDTAVCGHNGSRCGKCHECCLCCQCESYDIIAGLKPAPARKSQNRSLKK